MARLLASKSGGGRVRVHHAGTDADFERRRTDRRRHSGCQYPYGHRLQSQSPFAARLAASDKAKNSDWLNVLQDKSLKFGRTDPYNDPQGQNIVFTMLLAEKYYHQPDAAKRRWARCRTRRRCSWKAGC